MYRLMTGMVVSTVSVAMQAALLTALSTDADGHKDYRLAYGTNAALWGLLSAGFILITLITIHERHSFFGDVVVAVSADEEGVVDVELDNRGKKMEEDMIPAEECDEGATNMEASPSSSGGGKLRHFGRSLWEALSDRAFVLVCLTYTCAWVSLNFIQNNLLLYSKYVIDAEEYFIIFTLIIGVFTIVSLKPWEWISGKIGKKRAYYLGACTYVVAGSGLTFLPAGTASVVLLMVGLVVGAFSVGCMLLLPWAMLPDVVERHEVMTGKRNEGTFYSFFVFFQKAGLGLSLGLSTLVLAAAGYDSHNGEGQAQEPDAIGDLSPPYNGTSAAYEDAAQDGPDGQPPSVALALRIMVGAFPMVLIASSIVAVYFFPITRTSHALVSKELAHRRRLASAPLALDDSVVSVTL